MARVTSPLGRGRVGHEQLPPLPAHVSYRVQRDVVQVNEDVERNLRGQAGQWSLVTFEADQLSCDVMLQGVPLILLHSVFGVFNPLKFFTKRK